METIPQYLERVWRKDTAKGYDGRRSTREVADFFGIRQASARQRLHGHFEAGEIERIHDGNMYLWRRLPTPTDH